jgi:hypothetical protein
MIIKHSTGKIDSVYDNKKEAEEKIEKEITKKEEKEEDGEINDNN